MSIIHDYTVTILAAQRQREFAAEAANDRLVRLALGDRPVWWRRLLRLGARPESLAPEAPQRASAPEAPQRASAPEAPQRASAPEAPQRASAPEAPQRASAPEAPQRAPLAGARHRVAH